MDLEKFKKLPKEDKQRIIQYWKEYATDRGDELHELENGSLAITKDPIEIKCIEILKDLKLLERIDKELNKKIVREYEARKVIFLVANMRNVENLTKGTDNLIVNAQSGTGKDHVSESVFELLPDEEKEELVKTTPKVLSYTRNRQIEPESTWKKTALRLEDVPQNVANDDSFKVFLSANPNKINYGKTINKGKVIHIEIEGKPSMILTIADPLLKNEQLRRLPYLFLDESIDQNKEIMKRQAKYAKLGKSILYDDEIKTALKYLKRVNVVIPFADKLIKIFEESAGNVIVRTAFPRFLDYIKTSASLHQYQRDIASNGWIIANEQDYELGALCLKKTTSNLHMIPLNHLDSALYHFFKEQDGSFSVDELMDFKEIQELGKGDRWIRFRLDFLVSKNFLKRKSVKVEHSYKPVIKYSYKEVGDFYIPPFTELLKMTSNSSNTTNNTNTSDTSNTKENEVFEENELRIEHVNFSKSGIKEVLNG
jgi:hypothetical protein